MSYFAHPSAVIDQPCEIGAGTRIWHFSHVCQGARIGRHCVLGQNTMVAGGAILGDRVKVQNNVAVYSGVTVEDDVFLGPSCVLTNISNPRAQIDRRELFEATLIRRGATLGASSTILCGTTLGRYCFVAAGAVITRDAPDYALMIGVPARQVAWVSRHGHRLLPDQEGRLVCPESRFRYQEVSPGVLRCLDLDEEAELPEGMRIAKKSFPEWKARGSDRR